MTEVTDETTRVATTGLTSERPSGRMTDSLPKVEVEMEVGTEAEALPVAKAVKDATLVMNAGSSSLKFAVYANESDGPRMRLRGKISGIGTHPSISAHDADGQPLQPDQLMAVWPEADHEALIPPLLDWLEHHEVDMTITCAGHRVVHGGRRHRGPARVTPALLEELETLIALAPLHQPHNLAAIRCLAATAPHLTQIACFDTSFHRTQDPLAQQFALPRHLTDSGVLRYGFHGLSYEYLASQLPHCLGAAAEGAVIAAHLGNGASLCAMRERRSVATSMGFTALEGLMMGQRCGSLDPGVVLYLLESLGMSIQDVSQLLYEQSGLLGVSGISNDMAELEAHAAPEARTAIALFCYRAANEIAALATALGGLDSIVFTAGIGENSSRVRQLIISRLGWLGARLDADANARHERKISSDESRIGIYIIATDEEIVIAQEAHDRVHLCPGV